MKKILVLNFSILAILITVGCRQSIKKEIQDLKNKFTVGLNKINEHQIIPDSTNSNLTNSSPTNSSPTNSSPTNSSPTNSSPTNSSPTNSSPTNSSPTDVVNTNTLLDNNKDEQAKRIELANEFKMKTDEHSSYIGQYLILRQNNNPDILDNLKAVSDLIQDIHEQKNDVLLQKSIDDIIDYNITSGSLIDYGSNPNSINNDNDINILKNFFSQMQKEHRTKLIEILLWNHAIDLIFEAVREFKKDHLVKNKNHESSDDDIVVSPEYLIMGDFYLNSRFIIDYIDDAYEMVAKKFKNKDDILECADVLITESKKIYKFLEDSFSGN